MSNPKISFEQASIDAQNLINSYNGVDYSDIYRTDTYSILLHDETLINPCTALYVMHNEEINPIVDINSYSAGTYEIITSPLNAGLPIHIDGVIIDDLITDSIGHSTLNVVDESGNVIVLHLSYPKFCIDLGTNKKYTFYGIVTKNAGLRLEYFSEYIE